MNMTAMIVYYLWFNKFDDDMLYEVCRIKE